MRQIAAFSSMACRRWLAISALLLTTAAQAYAVKPGDWSLVRNRDGIKVYTRNVAGSKYKAVKASTSIHASLQALAALVRDNRECPKWQSMCERARALKFISPQNLYVYQVSNLPWPVADRDVVVHVIWRQDAKTRAVIMTANAVTGMMPHQKGMVRVTRASTTWTFMPVGQGRVRVTTVAHVNPGGPMPAWLVNMLLVDSPYTTLRNMRKILATGRYDKARLGFIKPPRSRGLQTH